MTDYNNSVNSSSQLLSSSLMPPSQEPGSSQARPRNRRVTSASGEDGPRRRAREPAAASASSSSAGRRGASNVRQGPGPGHSRVDTPPNIGQFLGESLNQSWSSVQGFASSLLSGVSGQDPQHRSTSRNRQPWAARRSPSSEPRGGAPSSRAPSTWGPAQFIQDSKLEDVGAGSLAERESALKAAKTASVLESHDGVNGGLDVTGKHKRRNSSENAQGSQDNTQSETCHVYVHQVQSSDTYAGLILRYRCREDVFKRANGLWSRDSVQTRKWLLLPVDACEVRGRPCDEVPQGTGAGKVGAPQQPSRANEIAPQSKSQKSSSIDLAGEETNDVDQPSESDRPWEHVRWVVIDSFPEPVEVGRAERRAMGYFPPRRRKSLRSASFGSAPRLSSDLSTAAPTYDGQPKSRRESSLSNEPRHLGTPSSSRSRVGSDAADAFPAWMRQPGGVGTMGRNVRAPGPENDYFNSWAKKHLPGLNVEGLPSMSMMGTETARFGFGSEPPSIAESPYEEGRSAASNSRQGNNLDRAAATVETWLRGAFAKRPSTPLLGGRPRPPGGSASHNEGDLIELTDAASEDGGFAHESSTSLLDSLSLGSSANNYHDTIARSRAADAHFKGKKAE